MQNRAGTGKWSANVGIVMVSVAQHCARAQKQPRRTLRHPSPRELLLQWGEDEAKKERYRAVSNELKKSLEALARNK